MHGIVKLVSLLCQLELDPNVLVLRVSARQLWNDTAVTSGMTGTQRSRYRGIRGVPASDEPSLTCMLHRGPVLTNVSEQATLH